MRQHGPTRCSIVHGFACLKIIAVGTALVTICPIDLQSLVQHSVAIDSAEISPLVDHYHVFLMATLVSSLEVNEEVQRTLAHRVQGEGARCSCGISINPPFAESIFDITLRTQHLGSAISASGLKLT